ncbi:MAG: DUF2797 domain-containing protein [Bacteroidales bacterium]|nr:DUF2797 domain-containing protein [Bacteroidales bacterium]MBN2749285.1 DUF2797 domain-containing protein [Bacteroidales bacterium]
MLKKMAVANSLSAKTSIKPVYTLFSGTELVEMNSLIGKRISLQFTGDINCIKCGRKTKKSFGQGFCYPCFVSAPETEECVIRPELCRAHEGVARDMAFARENCLIDQVVYLAVSGGLKVGVTRIHQVPTRWIDQGASWAIVLLTAPNRHSAGVVEVELKKSFADKTKWQSMLKGKDEFEGDLLQEKQRALALVEEASLIHNPADNSIYQIEYPVLQYPEKIKSSNLDKDPLFSGTLMGIRGQYLILEGGVVLNVRSYAGYNVELSF